MRDEGVKMKKAAGDCPAAFSRPNRRYGGSAYRRPFFFPFLAFLPPLAAFLATFFLLAFLLAFFLAAFRGAALRLAAFFLRFCPPTARLGGATSPSWSTT